MGFIMWLGEGYESLAPVRKHGECGYRSKPLPLATLFEAFHQQRIGVSPAKLCALTDSNWVLPTKTYKKKLREHG